MRLNPDIDPVGTEHIFKMWSGAKPVEAIYAVVYVTPQHAFAPSVAAPVVYLRLNRRTGAVVDNFIALPLPVFVELSMPFSEKDVFWVNEKTQA